jgi:predicted lipoprotein with Yx(FWY)xxD motif
MKLKQLKFALVAFVAIIFFQGCSSDSGSDNGTTTPPVVKNDGIMLSTSATLGSYLTDKTGRSLYFFATDANGQTSCTGGCEAFWPAFFVDNLTADKLGAGLTLSDFATITNTSGKKQLTYKGWPLYYYAPLSTGDGYGSGVNKPEAAGQTSGEGIDGTWFVAKPDYSIMIVRSQLVGHDGKNYKANYTVGDEQTTYFTDGKGLTLYTFKNDKFQKNNFTAADFSNNAVWPIYETDKIVVPSILDKSKFSVITVFGKSQLVYNGWPLYYFGQDASVRGANKGISFPSPGIWPVPVKDIPLAL